MHHGQWCLWAFVVLLLARVECQLSDPVVHDSQLLKNGNKFLEREASDDKREKMPLDEEPLQGSQCPVDVTIKWMTEVTSSIYATPLIADLYGDGQRDILVPSFVHHLEVLEGFDGAQSAGWPAFHRSTLHSSPVLFDWDGDGVQDVVIATYNGEIIAFKDTGDMLPGQIQVERLPVRKDWYVGLAPDHVDHSHPDVGSEADVTGVEQQQEPDAPVVDGKSHKAGFYDTASDGAAAAGDSNDNSLGASSMAREAAQVAAEAQQAVQAGQEQQVLGQDVQDNSQYQQQQQQQQQGVAQQSYQQGVAQHAPPQVPVQGGQRGAHGVAKPVAPVPVLQQQQQQVGTQQVPVQQQQQQVQVQQQAVQQQQDPGRGQGGVGEQAVGARRRLLQASEEGAATAEAKGFLSDEAEASFHELFDEKAASGGEISEDGGGIASVTGPPNLPYPYDDYDAMVPHDTRVQDGPVLGERHGRMDSLFTDDYYDIEQPSDEDLWEEEEYIGTRHSAVKGFVEVDPHVLCNPVFADIDNDGNEEMILAVSYFFDKDTYDSPTHAAEVSGISIDKYVGGAIVVYDIVTSRHARWRTHLDLSSDETQFRAYIYSAPTVADINGDGYLEILVGTSMGFLYILDYKGNTIPGWPIQMGEIQAQPAVADVDGDGWLEVVAADVRGNVAVFNRLGKELWEQHVASMITQAPSVGDIDGDGALEVVFGTGSGRILAMRAATGELVPPFPVLARGKIMAPVLLVKLQDGGKGQHVVVPAFDGLLYLVEGATGCVDTMDFGETSYSMVLADDLDGNGRLDLLLVTMNGNVVAMDTSASYQPLKTMSSQVHGINNFVSRYDWVGIYATKASRQARDVRGQSFSVQFVVVDKRPAVPEGQGRSRNPERSAVKGTIPGRGPYKVSVMLKGVSVTDMNSGEQPVIGLSDVYDAPGTYTLTIPCPRTRTSGTVYIEMVDEAGVRYHDQFSVSFHMAFHRLLKWLLAVPFTVMAVAVLTMKNLAGEKLQLPSYLS